MLRIYADTLRCIEVCYIIDCIHFCVSPASSDNGDRRSKQCGEGFFQFTLHSAGVILDLPSAEGAAVILKSDRVSHIPKY